MPKRTHTCVSMPPTPSAVNLCPCSIPRNWVSFFLSFLLRPTDDVMHEPKSLNGFLLWVMEGDAIESNGFLLWVWKVMQLSRTDFFCG
jgi:hypothetical protein